MGRLNFSRSNVINKIMILAYALLLLLGPSAANATRDNSTIKITNILPTELFYTGKVDDLLWRDACDSWNLSPKQIEEFFKLSREYPEGKEYAEYSKAFDWAHCSMIGTLTADNNEWSFEINASGAAEWRNNQEVRAWGCSDAKCKELLIPEQNKPVTPPKPPVQIKQIYPAEFDKRYDLIESSPEFADNYCKSWNLTAEQAREFFELSDEYMEGRFQLFNWFPCNTNGVLESEGREWQFIVNQAATGIWRNGDVIRFWSCRPELCKNLNFTIPDDELEQIDDR